MSSSEFRPQYNAHPSDMLLKGDAYTRVDGLRDKVDQEVTVLGWVNSHRSSGKLSFIEVRDGSGYVQAVFYHPDLDEALVERLKEVQHECSVRVSGVVSKHPKKADTYELQAKSLEVINPSVDFPIGRKEHGPDFLLENRHLWLRSSKQWAIQRVRDTIFRSTTNFLAELGFIRIDSPILTDTACEGTTTLFPVEYHDLGTAFLSQSGQLYLEAAVMAHGRVYDFGPVFRAEKSKTRKHLSEFWMMDAEMAFCDLSQSLELQEQLISRLVSDTLAERASELALLERDTSLLEKVKPPFPRLTHREVVGLLREKGSEITEEIDLGAKDETLLSEIFDVPVFITEWPAEIKAFYMKRKPEDPKYVLAADLMAPEGFGELIGGSQREDDIDLLTERMIEEKIEPESLDWFLDLRKYGSVEHSGFGFGLERIVSWIAGVEHIRETIPFPRTLYRIRP